MSQRLLLLLVLGFALSSCLTAEKKITKIHLNPDGKSGSGTIVFSNIGSEPSDSGGVEEDLTTLVNDYYSGVKLETENKGMLKVVKKLSVVNGKLNGELSFQFSDLSDVGFFRYKPNGPIAYYTGNGGIF